jgi:hypothetical protein
MPDASILMLRCGEAASRGTHQADAARYASSRFSAIVESAFSR